jgi:hypothetical protein
MGGLISIYGDGEKKKAYDALESPSKFGRNTACAYAGINPADRMW